MKLTRLASAVLLASGAGFIACNVYNSSLKQTGTYVPVDPSQYGSGIGWWSKKNTKTSCISAGLPTADEAPKNVDGPSIKPIVLALDNMALGSLGRNGLPNQNDPPWESLGFNLDGLCTDSDGACATPAGAQAPVPCHSLGGIRQDGHNCRDNTFGQLEHDAVSLIGNKYGLSNEGFNCALCRGDYNFLIRISDWDGKPNDSQVRVDMYPSPGLVTPPPWACKQNDPNQTWRTQQCWQAGDKWTIQPGTYLGSIPKDGTLPDASLNDPAAYVRDGYLVAQLPDNVLFWFPGDNGVTRAYPLKLQGGVVAGKLQKDKNGHWEVADGTIAGRASVQDLIWGFEQIGLCASTVGSDFSLMTGYVSNYADILANGKIAPTAQCDALSVGIGFLARQATFSGTERAVKKLPGCPAGDGGVDGGDAGVDGSGGAGGSGGTDAGLDGAAGYSGCNDPAEPNDTPQQATHLATVACKGMTQTTSGMISSPSDVDYYDYGTLGGFCTAVTLTASTANSGLTTCLAPTCGASGSPGAQCMLGAPASVGSVKGCCSTGGAVRVRATCSNGAVAGAIVRVNASSNVPACMQYKLTYGTQ